MSYLSTTIQKLRYLVNRDDGDFLVLEKNNGAFVKIALDTPAARDAAITTAVNNLLAGVPGALDTLNELATALGDDANFAATVTTSLGNRLVWRGAWAAATNYVRNDLTMFNGGLYLAPTAFTSGASFVKANWVELVPQIGTYEAMALPVGTLAAGGDAASINALINAASAAGGGRVKGKSGGVFYLEGPVVPASNVTLDMTGCTLNFATGVTGNLIANKAVTAVSTGTGTMTAGSNVLTTALVASVGQTVIVTGAGGSASVAGPLVANVTAVGVGTLTLSLNAVNAVSGAATSVYTRDTNINVIGGTWNRGGAGGTGTGLHCLLFRHVDGLDVRAVIGNSTAGKYLIAIGDCTQFTVENPRGTPHSDGVHVNGPASNGVIRRVMLATGDDIVALTARDYAAYEDVCGDITDIAIDRTFSVLGKGIALIAGQGQSILRVSVDGVYGKCVTGAYPVRIIDDPADARTNGGGTYDEIELRNVHALPGGGLFAIQIAATGIRTLTLRDTSVDGGLASMSNNGQWLNQPSGSIEHLIIDGLNLRAMTSGSHAIFLAGTVDRLDLSNIRGALTGGSLVVLSGAAAAVAKGIALSHVRLDGNGGGSIVSATAAGVTCPYVQMSNVLFNNFAWLADVNCAMEIDLANVQGLSVSGLANVRASAALALVGHGCKFKNSGGGDINASVTAGGTLRINNRSIRTDATRINAQVDGDIVWNTQATLAGVKGSGLVVWAHSTYWQYATQTFVASGTAVLAAGTVTVSNASITASSRIRVFNIGAGGTVGALSVAVSAGTGFTVNSTSGADTSTIYYEIVTY